MDTDAVVIGAGAVGLACARALAQSGRSVIVLERHDRFGVETSSRNSEVVHAGIYYTPGSLKARLCALGNRSLYAYCESRGVPHRRIGKLIVATEPAEEPKLADILKRGHDNGVVSLGTLTPAEATRMEPNVRCTAALWSPDTGIVDSHQFMKSLLAETEAGGGTVAWRHTLHAAEKIEGGYRLQARLGAKEESTITTRAVVNSAGLDADNVAALAGLDPDSCGYRLHYARGHYFRVHSKKSHLASHLIYPTPIPGGLGIHVTFDLAGGMRLGPDVQYLEGREQNYDVPGSLRGPFHAAVSRYLTGLDEADLTPDLAGIRPKLSGAGEPPRDFVIAEESARGLAGWVNLVGIESPGLTCALDIAAMVEGLLEERA
ncbi:MAG: NAD(P)/FAD-dependent oxidoreductase [Gemmatimonadales bacterium]